MVDSSFHYTDIQEYMIICFNPHNLKDPIYTLSQINYQPFQRIEPLTLMRFLSRCSPSERQTFWGKGLEVWAALPPILPTLITWHICHSEQSEESFIP